MNLIQTSSSYKLDTNVIFFYAGAFFDLAIILDIQIIINIYRYFNLINAGDT